MFCIVKYLLNPNSRQIVDWTETKKGRGRHQDYLMLSKIDMQGMFIHSKFVTEFSASKNPFHTLFLLHVC